MRAEGLVNLAGFVVPAGVGGYFAAVGAEPRGYLDGYRFGVLDRSHTRGLAGFSYLSSPLLLEPLEVL